MLTAGGIGANIDGQSSKGESDQSSKLVVITVDSLCLQAVDVVVDI